ncbi:MAG: DUF72 domain-containing protein [Gemmatimonadaceae bacterium]|nr:DUF72 domain-containing protein [Gemmatimonadaceae bacterium]
MPTPPDPAAAAAPAFPTLRLGAQGWNYPAWVGAFYPPRTRPADFLSVYARAFDTVEVDSTFYAVPAARTVRGWAERTPPGFTFALKLPQEITHELRFVGAGEVAERFYDAARELGPKLGPVLIQCGPDFAPGERGALEDFLYTLPDDIAFAIEFRQRGWIDEGVLGLLEQRRVALALVDARWIPRPWMLKLAARPTAPHAYVRWMGPDRSITDYSHVQVDRTAELEAWAAILPTLAKSVKVYGYVNNHFSGHSPASIRWLQAALGQVAVDPARLEDQLGLF